MIDAYCSSEAEAELVRSKTSEEFYFWMERKKKAIRKQIAELKRATKKGTQT